ncbi:LemA family protein [Shewanella cyperi]|uniref:LemA family protein n=1 Tax=Shewanella cyperi TaxID=2814292 RepID=UPI001A94A913|nr:LemA family protein [Shewanella cyperi]QSX40812.1 LemA family protein [Shewanella cyperi]
MEGLLLGLGLLLILTYLWYVSLLKKRATAREALQSVDHQLSKRSQLITTLLARAQTEMAHEQPLPADIIKLQEQTDGPYQPQDARALQQHLQAADQLHGKMSLLFAQLENTPTLLTDSVLLQSMQAYSELETQLCSARRFYNAAVTELNTAVAIFPGSIIARLANIGPMPFYEAGEADQAPVNTCDLQK